MDSIRASLETSGTTFTSTDRDGVKLWTAEAPASTGMGPTTIEIAVSADQVIVGLNGGGATALDVHAGKADPLSSQGDLAQLIERLPKARAATMVVNTRALLQMGTLPSPLPSAIAAALKATPDAGVASLSFDADAIRMDFVSGPVPDGASSPALANDLAAEVPGDALVFFEGAGFGDAIGLSVESLKASAAANPATAAVLAELDQVESALGVKLEHYFDWAGGTAVAAGRNGNDPWGGVLFEVDDAAVAGQRIGQLDTFVALAASDPTSGITITHPTASGVTFTGVRIAIPGASLPMRDVVFEYALTGDRVLLPTVLEAYMYSRDPTPEELARARRNIPEPESVPAAPAPTTAPSPEGNPWAISVVSSATIPTPDSSARATSGESCRATVTTRSL